MSLRTIHKNALNNRCQTAFHEFKLHYVKKSKIIFGFVEGKDDPAFYRGFCENLLDEDWKILLWPMNGRDNVLKIHSKIDWRSFNKNQILFFVDKDLTNFLKKSAKTEQEKNIFVTQKYSIENDLVNRNTCSRLLREIFGFSHLKFNEEELILNIFEDQKKVFCKFLVPVMAYILHWRKKKLQANINDIKMSDLFRIVDGKLVILNNNNCLNLLTQYIHQKCNLTVDNSINLNKYVDELKKEKYDAFVRGKYIFWFLIEFCKSIHNDCPNLSYVSFKKSPKLHFNVSHKASVTLVANRCRIPQTLKKFLNGTLQKYVSSIQRL